MGLSKHHLRPALRASAKSGIVCAGFNTGPGSRAGKFICPIAADFGLSLLYPAYSDAGLCHPHICTTDNSRCVHLIDMAIQIHRSGDEGPTHIQSGDGGQAFAPPNLVAACSRQALQMKQATMHYGTTGTPGLSVR